MAARPHLADTFFLSCADVYANIDYPSLAMHHTKEQKLFTLVATPHEETAARGTIEYKDKKPEFHSAREGKSGPGLVDTGVWAASKGFLEKLVNVRDLDLAKKKTFEEEQGGVFLHTGVWFDIGTPKSYADACSFARTDTRRSPRSRFDS